MNKKKLNSKLLEVPRSFSKRLEIDVQEELYNFVTLSL